MPTLIKEYTEEAFKSASKEEQDAIVDTWCADLVYVMLDTDAGMSAISSDIAEWVLGLDSKAPINTTIAEIATECLYAVFQSGMNLLKLKVRSIGANETTSFQRLMDYIRRVPPTLQSMLSGYNKTLNDVHVILFNATSGGGLKKK